MHVQVWNYVTTLVLWLCPQSRVIIDDKSHAGYYAMSILWKQDLPATHDLVPRLQLIKRLTTNQGHSHQIWSDWVGSVCTKMPYPRGAWGHAPPGKFWNLGAMRLLLRPILGQYDASRRPNDRVSHECHSAHCVVHQCCWLSDPVRLSAKSHTLCRWS